MGGLCSTLGPEYDTCAELWQAPSKWHNQQTGTIGISATGHTCEQNYHKQETPPRIDLVYQQKQFLKTPVQLKTPHQQATQLGETPDYNTGDTQEQREEAEDEFPAKHQLPTAPTNWSRGELIGAGAFGRVYLGLNNENGELVAVKQVTISKEEALAGRVAQHVRELEKEVNVLKQLDHPNIVRYLGTDRSKDCLNIFLEYVPGGSIASLLSKFGSFKETVIKIYARQILLGLGYLHAHKIMHRDIKGANILVDNTGLVKLADFGASKKIEDLVTIDSGVKSIKGTSYWMAPEVIKQTGHGRMADIWSVGCTVIEMATGKPPWSQFSSQVSAMFHIASSKGPPPIPEHLSPEAKDFLLLCFNRVPSDRPNAARLLQHPFLADAAGVKRSHAAPLANLAKIKLPHRAPSPLKDESERSSQKLKAGGGTPLTRLSSSSGDFLKLYSPMADRVAEAAARSRPASTTGEREKPGWLRDAGLPEDLPTIDGQMEAMRQSVASHASARYEGVAEDDLLGSPRHSAESDSDYNPVEEPTWLQNDSLQSTHFSYVANSSPSDTPRIRAFVEESTAVASPVRLQRQHRKQQIRHVADDSMEDIMTFVKEKAQRDTLRLSTPFGLQQSASMKGIGQPGTKQQQWEAELQQELAEQRTQIRSWMPV